LKTTIRRNLHSDIKEYEDKGIEGAKKHIENSTFSAVCAKAREQGVPMTKSEAGSRKGKKAPDNNPELSSV